jgi:hypothetical protein
MRPETIFLQLPPDLPVFIKNTKPKDDMKTHLLYKDQWFKFLKRAQDSAFLINPRPKFTSDIILNQERLKRLFEDNIIPASSDFELGPQTLYTQSKNTLDLHLKPDSLFTSLLYAYNQNTPAQIVIGDMPMLAHREMMCRRLKIKDCQDMFTRTIDKWEMQGTDNLQSQEGLAYDP